MPSSIQQFSFSELGRVLLLSLQTHPMRRRPASKLARNPIVALQRRYSAHHHRAWPARTAVSCASATAGAVLSEKLTTPAMPHGPRSEEHTSELQSLMRISYAVFCLKKKKKNITITTKH